MIVDIDYQAVASIGFGGQINDKIWCCPRLYRNEFRFFTLNVLKHGLTDSNVADRGGSYLVENCLKIQLKWYSNGCIVRYIAWN